MDGVLCDVGGCGVGNGNGIVNGTRVAAQVPVKPPLLQSQQMQWRNKFWSVRRQGWMRC